MTFPEYKLAAIRELIVPEIRRRVPSGEIAACLAPLLKGGAKPLRTIAEIYKMHHVTLRRRLRAAGIEPVGTGGKSGREELFDLDDAQAVLEAK